MIDLDSLIKSANKIDPLPATAARLFAVTVNDDWNWSAILDIIKFDPVMVSRLLRLSNSAAYYTKSEPILDIADAVTKLGISNVLAIAISSGIGAMLNIAVPQLGWEKEQLWHNAVAASLVPDEIAKLRKITPPKEATTAALLHNIGILVIRGYLKSEETTLLKKATVAVGDVYKAESELFNVNHAEIGALILQKWKLPPIIVDLVAYHNSPEESMGLGQDVVYLSCKVAGHLVHSSLEPDEQTLDAGVLNRLGITHSAYAILVSNVEKRLESVMSIYN